MLRTLALSFGAFAGALAAQSPGTFLGTFPSPTTAAPFGLQLDGTSGNLLITASGTPDEFHVMTTQGTSLSSWTPSQSNFPYGVATDGTNVYVADAYLPTSIDVYDRQGNHVRSMPTNSLTTFPKGLTYVAATGRLVLVDGRTPQCFELDLQGNLLATHALNGTSCTGISWHAATNSYWVYDAGTDSIRRYDASFNELSSFLGTRAQGLSAGEGLAQVGEILYVVASTSRQIAMFDATGNAGIVARYGLGCPTPSVIYERFAANTVDLSGIAYSFSPNSLGGYDVRVCSSGCFDPNLGTNLGLPDDQVSPAQLLGFPFPIPGGGTTNDVEVSSNGFVYLQTGQSAGHGCCIGDPAAFLSGPARIAALWQDLDPSSAASGGGVFFRAGSGRATITWSQVPEFGQNANPLTVQIQLHASGQFVINWVRAANVTHQALVGYSMGNGAVDPGSIDLSSAVPFSTVGGGIPLVLHSTDRPVLGGSLTLVTSNLPAGVIATGIIVGSQRTAVPLGRLGAPGCSLYSLGEITTIPLTVANPTITLAVPATPSLANVALYLQSAAIAPGVNTLSAVMSNGLELAFGPY